jgi:hypothetical protein
MGIWYVPTGRVGMFAGTVESGVASKVVVMVAYTVVGFDLLRVSDISYILIWSRPYPSFGLPS